MDERSGVMKSICLFNHKGGVSKTTTTFNLGWMLANKGYKVVMVDLDSQCNLTGQVFGYKLLEEDYFETFYNERTYISMSPIVKGLVDGESVESIIKLAGERLYETQNPNLMLLAGHLNVSDLDSQITVSLKIASGIPATKNIVGNLPAVLKRIAENFDADYLLFDLSPNVGGLNEIILMSSDYFIVPTSPDYFCVQAIDSLTKNIKKWKREINRFKEDNEIVQKNYAVHNEPKFIGIIQQRYRPRSERPASSFQNWIDKINIAVNNKLVPTLEDLNCILPHDHIKTVLEKSDLKPYTLAYIPDFNSLIAISHLEKRPIFELTSEDIRKHSNVFGRALDTMAESAEKFHNVFDGLTDRIIEITR